MLPMEFPERYMRFNNRFVPVIPAEDQDDSSLGTRRIVRTATATETETETEAEKYSDMKAETGIEAAETQKQTRR